VLNNLGMLAGARYQSEDGVGVTYVDGQQHGYTRPRGDTRPKFSGT
jgi:hypothetical protein